MTVLRNILRHAGLVALAALTCACASKVEETHYFAAYRGEDRSQPSEFFRLTVEGTTQMSSARFVAGYYDERAVDLLFNEMRVSTDTAAQVDTCDCDIEPLFNVRTHADGSIDPLNPTLENGAFVLILSNNADAVVRTIGSFSESQLVADAVTNLLNRDRIVEAAEAEAADDATRAAARASTSIIASALDRAAAAPDAETAQAEYLRALDAMARPLGRATGFDSPDDARAWFEEEFTRRMRAEEP